MMHNFMFDEYENFTLLEILPLLNFSVSYQPFSSQDLATFMKIAGLLVEDDGDWENIYDWTFVDVSAEDKIKTNAISILNKAFLRYKDHYCVQVKCPVDATEKLVKSYDLMKKMLKICDYTYDKYSTLIDLYGEEKAHLLDKLGRTRSGNRSVSQSGQNAENSVHMFNDTPQTTDVIATMEGNQYVSELNKNSVAGSTASSGSDTFQEAEEWDNATIMARLSEIEKQFSQVWKNWLDEFDQLFIEEVNY